MSNNVPHPRQRSHAKHYVKRSPLFSRRRKHAYTRSTQRLPSGISHRQRGPRGHGAAPRLACTGWSPPRAAPCMFAPPPCCMRASRYHQSLSHLLCLPCPVPSRTHPMLTTQGHSGARATCRAALGNRGILPAPQVRTTCRRRRASPILYLEQIGCDSRLPACNRRRWSKRSKELAASAAPW